jgi:hypothetical protein
MRIVFKNMHEEDRQLLDNVSVIPLSKDSRHRFGSLLILYRSGRTTGRPVDGLED